MENFVVSDVVDRLRVALNAKTDASLSDMIGVSAATLSHWRKRNTIDMAVVYNVCDNINMDWLLTGRGSMSLGAVSQKEAAFPELLSEISAKSEEIGMLKERIRWLTNGKDDNAIFHE